MAKAKTLTIITYPAATLRQKSRPLKEAELIDAEIDQLILDMAQTMKVKDGVGLAAPQVGKNLRLIVINHENGTLALINPQINWRSLLKRWEEEGCLSVPNCYGEVKRPKAIRLTFIDSAGQRKNLKAKGLLARVIQHEIDHLDGVLFIDKARRIKKINSADN